MNIFTSAINDFKNRFIMNQIKQIEYDSLDYIFENEDNLKLVKNLEKHEYITSFNANLTTLIYKSKCFFIVKSYLYLVIKKEDKIYMYVYSIHHTNYNKVCKTKIEIQNKNCLVFSNIDLDKLNKNIKLIRDIDVLTKKDDKHFSSINSNIDIEFPDLFNNIIVGYINNCKIEN